eukprot:gene7035-7249_t
MLGNSNSCRNPAAAKGVNAIIITNNNPAAEVNDTRIFQQVKVLHDCGLTQFVLGGTSFGLSGTLLPEWGQLDRLEVFAIFQSNVTGTIPSELSNMKALRHLDLNSCYLYGTIPKSLGKLANLEVLNLGFNGFSDWGVALHGPLPSSFRNLKRLRILNLEQNGITGTLPPTLCKDLPELEAISLQSNEFEGPADQLGQCRLVALDVSENNFSGPLPRPVRGPNGSTWKHLHTFRLNNNNFSGTIPDWYYDEAPLLELLRLNNNSLTGTLPVSWTLLPWLTSIDVSFNRLSGTLPWELAFQSRLAHFDVSYNTNLTGTITPWFRLTVGLQTFNVQGTNVKGVLPGITRTQFSKLENIERLCGSNASGFGRLPQLTAVSIFSTNMSAECEPSGYCEDIDDALPWYLTADNQTWLRPEPEEGLSSNANMQCPMLIQNQFCRRNGTPEYFQQQQRPIWRVSPSYYHYVLCQCVDGFTPRRVLQPHGNLEISVLYCDETSSLSSAKVAAITALSSFVAAMLLAYIGYVGWYGRWGLPRLERAYVDFKKRLQGIPTSGKVSIVVTDIESYSALMVAMPLVMGAALSQHNNIIRKAAWTHFGYIIGQEGDAYILVFRDAMDAAAFCLQVQQALHKADWPTELLQHQQQLDYTKVANSPNSVAELDVAAVARLSSQDTDVMSSSPAPGVGALQKHLQAVHPREASGIGAVPAMLSPSSFGPQRSASSPSPPCMAQGGFSNSSRSLALQSPYASSPLLKTTQGSPGVAGAVSDTAAGGQVLLDSNTFGLISNRLEELGQVGRHGYRGGHRRVTGWGQPRGPLARLMARTRVQVATEAVVLDMGLYSLPGFPFQHATDVAGAPAVFNDLLLPSTVPTSASAATAPAVGDLMGCLRFYQILPPKLMERAHIFGNKLTLREGSRCHDLPYFSLPRSGDAATTFVFCSIALPKSRLDAALKSAVLEQVSTLVAHVIRQCLLAVTDAAVFNSVAELPGATGLTNSSLDGSGCMRWRGSGYLCQDMRRDMKYILAFSCPRSVWPDYAGRADYHGHAVNMAARYEAVCSQGGQVVCDAALAQAVVAEWMAAAAATTLAVEAGAAMSLPSEGAASTGSMDVVNCSFAAPAVQQQCPSGAQPAPTSGATRPAAESPPRAGLSFQFTSPALTPAGRLDSSGKWGFNDPRLLHLPEVSLQPRQPVLQSPGGASGTAAGSTPDRALLLSHNNQRWRMSVPSGSGRRRWSGSKPVPSAGASRRGTWGSSRGGSGSGGGLREVLVEAPSPEPPCPSCIPQLPQEQCDVEVHSIGRFQLKGASGPVDMVEVVLGHLAGRRLLLIDSGLPKGQKGKLLEPAQPGSSLMAAVHDVQLPGLGAMYRRQYEQRRAAAAAMGAAAAVTAPHPGPQGQAAKQAATHAGADGRSAARQSGSQRQLSFFGRSSSSVTASAASLGVRMGSWTRASLHSAASSSSSALPAAQPECSSGREAGQ